MEKKNYIKPELQVVMIEEQNAILSASNPQSLEFGDDEMSSNDCISTGSFSNVWDDTDNEN